MADFLSGKTKARYLLSFPSLIPTEDVIICSSPARPCLYGPLDLSLLQSSQYLGDEVEQKGWQETHDFHAFTRCARRASWALTQLISLQAGHSWCYTPVVQIRKLRHREVDIQAGKWWIWVSRCAVAVKRPT